MNRRSLIEQMINIALLTPWAGASATSAEISKASASLGRIKGVVLQGSAIRRFPGSLGGGFTSTWTSDDRLLMEFADGVNLDETENYHSRIYEIKGTPENFSFEELPGYPHMQMQIRGTDQASYWAGPCLAIDNTIYQFLMTSNHAYIKPDGSFWPGFGEFATKVIYSPDNGATWHNQDGSAPVRWESWNARSKQNMLFYDEEITGGNVVQMGKAYGANKDGYVYMYVAAKAAQHQLSISRVPKSRILERGAYEFFAGRLAHGKASWTKDVKKRVAMHSFPEGRLATKSSDGSFPAGWSTNVVYNEALDVYMMVAQGQGASADGGSYGKPSYLGFWVASTPWGPFKQIHENTAWTPNGDAAARAFSPAIVPKWIAADGKSFWIVWSDYQYQGPSGETQYPDAGLVAATEGVVDPEEQARVFAKFVRAHMPECTGHLQRVDLMID